MRLTKNLFCKDGNLNRVLIMQKQKKKDKSDDGIDSFMKSIKIIFRIKRVWDMPKSAEHIELLSDFFR